MLPGSLDIAVIANKGNGFPAVSCDLFGKPDGADHALDTCMFTKLDEVDQITERAIACAIEVHRTMGTGLLESIYEECMILECSSQGLRIDCEQIVPVDYKGTRLISRFKIDILAERRLVLELKAVEAIRPVHKAQVISYLKLTGHPAGLLINFHEPTLKAGLHRLDHPDRYALRKQRSSGVVPEP
jgi:GxxExxY protein